MRIGLGGVTLPGDRGPLGHSDGDCLFHAVTDALLGASGLGDMGKFFPDTDPRWKDVASAVFLKEARRMLAEKQLTIGNIDVNLHLEAPQLAPYLAEMVRNLSEHLGVPADRINLKAKRGEGMDSVGRGEAVAAQVIVLLSEKT